MKKLMIAGIAALSAAVSFGVESANVVGYAGAALRGNAQAAGAGACFVNVDSTDLTLANLKITGYDAADGYADFEVYAKKLDGFGRGGTSFYWCDFEEEGTTYYGWYDEDMNDYNNESVTIGEGLWIYSPSADYQLQSAGQVPTSDISVVLRSGGQAKLIANPMPLTITLSAIKVEGYETTDGYADFEIYAKKLDGFGIGGTSYYWCDFEEEGTTYYGWYDEDMNEYNEVEVAAGEALWVYSPSTDFAVVFPAPEL